MVRRTLEVISEYDPKKNYGVDIDKRTKKVLTVLKKGDKVSAKEFIDEHLDEFSLNGKKISHHANQQLVYKSFKVGEKIGILQEIKNNEMPFNEFFNFESIQYCVPQIRGSKFKNLPPKKSTASTQRAYFYHLWNFSKWLTGKTFEYDKYYEQGENIYKKETKEVTLENLEHLLKLYEGSRNDKPFRKIIRKYLQDPRHAQKKASTLNVTVSAIKAYFKHNETDFDFSFDPKVSHQSVDDEKEEASFTLVDLMKILTQGRPSITQKAVMLCKFHRGLDTSTLVDRFNFQAWDQLVKYFGTEIYTKWDLDKCPVPIKLMRMKKDFIHTGFLDRDAIDSIKTYLDYRFKKTGKPMQNNEALFLNGKNEHITPSWVRQSFARLAENAGIQRKLKGYNLRTRYEKDSHEFRDLLKSTLIDCGVRYDVADHVIGHKPKDSYEKQHKLYSDTMRFEFMKASGKLNIFSNYEKNIEGSYEIQNLYNENQKMQVELSDVKEDLAMVMKHNKIAQKFPRKK